MTNHNNETVTASMLMARFDYLTTEERAAIKEQAQGMIQDYLEGDWYIYRGNLLIDGDFDNDIALVVDGNLTVHGTYNDYQSDIGYLLCLGDFRAQNVLSWNAFAVAGSLYAAGFVCGYYNDFPFEVLGDVLQARGMFFMDKSCTLPKHQLVEVGSHEGHYIGDLETSFMPTLLKYYDDDFEEISLSEAQAYQNNQHPVHVDIVDSWSLIVENVYDETVFRQPYDFSNSPQRVPLDTLRLSIMQPDVPEAVLIAALVRPPLQYDLALAPETSADLLILLSKNPEWHIREAVASHPHTPEQTLQMLAKDQDDKVRAALIHNQQVPPYLVDRLIEDASPLVRRAIATSELAQPHLEALLEDKEMSVRRALASHPALTLPHLRKLIADPVPEVRQRALYYTPPDRGLVEEFTASDNPELRAWAIRRLNQISAEQENEQSHDTSSLLKADQVLELLLSPDNQVREVAFQKEVWIGVLPLDTVCQYAEQFAQDELDIVRLRIAEICRDAAILAQLAEDPNEGIRQVVATNLATPAEVLMEMTRLLAQSSDTGDGLWLSPKQSFSLTLLENPLLPAEAFKYIQEILPVGARIEPHSNLPLDVYMAYEYFSDPYGQGDQEYEEMQTAYTLIREPAKALSFMARSSRWEFCALAAIHAQTPPDALQHILTTNPQDKYLLENLAANQYLGQNTPTAKQMITSLLELGDSEVEYALLANPYLPQDVLIQEAYRAPDEAKRVLWQRYGVEWTNAH